MEDILTKGSVIQLINDRGDCRTAPATPGLLNIVIAIFIWLSAAWLDDYIDEIRLKTLNI